MTAFTWFHHHDLSTKKRKTASSSYVLKYLRHSRTARLTVGAAAGIAIALVGMFGVIAYNVIDFDFMRF